MTFLNEIV
jgi:hypothetical protein